VLLQSFAIKKKIIKATVTRDDFQMLIAERQVSESHFVQLKIEFIEIETAQ